MVTVILVCWKRFERFEEIIKVWLNEPEVSEVIIWDNSGSFRTSLPVTLINSQKNINPSVRYMLGSIAANDIIICCDDDVLPRSGITSDFIKYFDANSFLGVEGINFVGNSYFHQERIRNVKVPSYVDLVVGYLTMVHKDKLLGLNYINFSKYQLEMNLQCLVKFKKLVIPTDKFEELSCSKDKYALHLDPNGRKDKERMYKKYFSKIMV